MSPLPSRARSRLLRNLGTRRRAAPSPLAGPASKSSRRCRCRPAADRREDAQGAVLKKPSLRQKGDKPVEERTSEDVQPPVAAADLPPIVGEDAPKVPFWKKELSLGGKKGDKPVKERKAGQLHREPSSA